MAIKLNDNIDLASSKPLDQRYGPYTTVALAVASIPAFKRYQGLTVGIVQQGAVVDYWFRDGTADNQLILKTVGGDTGGLIGGAIGNFDGGHPNSVYGGISPIDAGGVVA